MGLSELVKPFVDIFAYGSSSIRVYLFIAWLVFLLVLYVTTRGNVKRDSKYIISEKIAKKAWLCCFCVLTLISLLLYVYTVHNFDLSYQHAYYIGMPHAEDYITRSFISLTHMHVLKPIFLFAHSTSLEVGYPFYQLFGSLLYAFVGVFFIGLVLFLILDFIRTPRKDVVFLILFAVCSFGILKGIIDGGPFNLQTILCLVALLATQYRKLSVVLCIFFYYIFTHAIDVASSTYILAFLFLLLITAIELLHKSKVAGYIFFILLYVCAFQYATPIQYFNQAIDLPHAVSTYRVITNATPAINNSELYVYHVDGNVSYSSLYALTNIPPARQPVRVLSTSYVSYEFRLRASDSYLQQMRAVGFKDITFVDGDWQYIHTNLPSAYLPYDSMLSVLDRTQTKPYVVWVPAVSND